MESVSEAHTVVMRAQHEVDACAGGQYRNSRARRTPGQTSIRMPRDVVHGNDGGREPRGRATEAVLTYDERMMPILLLTAMSLVFAQTAPAANPACSLLTSSQITSLIGAAKTVPVSVSPMGSACMLQSGDKIVTVLIVNNSSPDGATRQFESKKRVVSGGAIPGWTLPSYAGSRPSTAVAGFLNGLTLTEVKLADPALSTEAVGVKLLAVMKELAGR